MNHESNRWIMLFFVVLATPQGGVGGQAGGAGEAWVAGGRKVRVLGRNENAHTAGERSLGGSRPSHRTLRAREDCAAWFPLLLVPWKRRVPSGVLHSSSWCIGMRFSARTAWVKRGGGSSPNRIPRSKSEHRIYTLACFVRTRPRPSPLVYTAARRGSGLWAVR